MRHLPVTGVAGVDIDLYALSPAIFGLSVAGFLVDVDLLTVLRATGAVFEYSYVLGVGFTTLSRLLDVDREGFVTFSVTFPPCLW